MAGKTLVCNGTICDGSGAEPFAGEILLDGERIAAVGAPGTLERSGAELLDACGLAVAPGFIDAHSHGDFRKIKHPGNRSKLLQGITTEVDGNCGLSASCASYRVGDRKWSGVKEYIRILADTPASTNTVVLCGHNTLRGMVMGQRSDRASARELAEMRRILEEAFASGAAGWSTGLTYLPGKFSDTAELTALAEVSRGTQKIYATHLRSEGDRLLEAIEEAFAVAGAGSGRLQLSHLKTICARNFHKIDALLDRIETAREAGFFVHADRYPYICSSTFIVQALPPPYDRDSGIAGKLRASEKFREEVAAALADCPRDLPAAILPCRRASLAEIAAAEGCSVEYACMREIMRDPSEVAAFRCMSEDNMLRILDAPWVCAGTDSLSMPLDDPADTGHPRSSGALPRFFRVVSARRGVGEAVRRMTSLPAKIFRIPERGLIRAGYVADLVIFDAGKLDSRAGFRGEDPYPVGVERVLVGGRTAWHAARPEHVERFGRYLAID